MTKELAHQVASFAIAALYLSLLGSTPARAENEQWRNYFTTRELRQPSSNRVSLESTKKTIPQAPFFLPEDAANKVGLFGADVSHWDFACDDCPSECEIDWKGLAWNQGIRFVYAEATRDVASLDPTFPVTWQTLKPLHDQGLIYRGAYHWLSSDPGISGALQAQWFLKNVVDGGLHLPYGLDFEPDYIQVTKDRYDAMQATAECKIKVINANGQNETVYLCDGWYGQTADVIVKKVSDWIGAVENNNQTAIIYTTSDYWQTMIGDKAGDILAARGVWLARYLDPAQYPHNGIPGSTIAPTNKWGMPPLPKGVGYPNGPLYSSRTNWQFEQCGQFRQTVWTCKGKPTPGPAPDTSVCQTATTAVMDMNWYPSSLADFKSAFGIK